MTKDELIEKYCLWAEKHGWYLSPQDIDNAVQILTYESGQTHTEHSGTRVLVVGRYLCKKVHLFIYKETTTWQTIHLPYGVDDGDKLRENYSMIISF